MKWYTTQAATAQHVAAYTTITETLTHILGIPEKPSVYPNIFHVLPVGRLKHIFTIVQILLDFDLPSCEFD